MDPGYYPVGRQKWRVACPTGLCLFARLISWLIGIVKSSSSGTIQVLILKLRYLVIRQEVFDGFNHIKLLSKDLLMSRRTMAVSFLLSMALRISSVVWITDVSVECHCLLSLCLHVKRPVASKYDMNCLCATRSQTFGRTGSGEIGLLLFRISWPISVFEYGYHFSYFLYSIALKVNCSGSG